MTQDIKRLIGTPVAVHRAQSMLQRMQQAEDPDSVRRAYNLWIHAIAKSNQHTAQDAEEVLSEMKERGVEPDAVTYTTLMDAYARSGEGAERRMFGLMEEALKRGGDSGFTIDTMLNAWAMQGTVESAERAEMTLLRLEDWNARNFQPTNLSYTTGECLCASLSISAIWLPLILIHQPTTSFYCSSHIGMGKSWYFPCRTKGRSYLAPHDQAI